MNPPISLRAGTARVRRVRTWLLLACGALVAAFVLAGCQRSNALPLRLTNISGHMPNLEFTLTDDNGKTVTASDYLGKVVLLYFGYTHCPDVCPLELARLHVAMQKLGPLADGAQILFVTVDPARDPPSVLHAYVNAFDKHIVGLTGNPRAIERLAKDYRSAFSREPGDANGNYEVTHGAGVYVFDQKGRARVIATPAASREDLIHDLHLLLNAGTAT